MWRLLHYVSWNITDAYTIEYIDLLHSLSALLPCKFCRKSFRLFYVSAPLSQALLRIPNFALKWIWLLHEFVNKKLEYNSLPFPKLCLKLYSTSEVLTVEDIVFVFACLLTNVDGDANRARELQRFDSALGILLRVSRGAPIVRPLIHRRLQLVGVVLNREICRHPARTKSKVKYGRFLNALQSALARECFSHNFAPHIVNLGEVAKQVVVANLKPKSLPCMQSAPNPILDDDDELSSMDRTVVELVTDTIDRVDAEWKVRKVRPCHEGCVRLMQQAQQSLDGKGFDSNTWPFVQCVLAGTEKIL